MIERINDRIGATSLVIGIIMVIGRIMVITIVSGSMIGIGAVAIMAETIIVVVVLRRGDGR